MRIKGLRIYKHYPFLTGLLQLPCYHDFLVELVLPPQRSNQTIGARRMSKAPSLQNYHPGIFNLTNLNNGKWSNPLTCVCVSAYQSMYLNIYVYIPATPLGCCLLSILLKGYLSTLWPFLTSLNGCLRSCAPSNGYLRPCTVIYVHASNAKTTSKNTSFLCFWGLTRHVLKESFRNKRFHHPRNDKQERGET